MPEVTLQHRELVQISQQGGTVLLVSDTTEAEFGIHREVEGLGPTGDGGGRGFFLQSSVAVDRSSGQALGLMAQDLFYRQEAPSGETRAQRLARERESETWSRVVDDIGEAPENVVYRHVFDRAGDNYEIFCHLENSGCEWVVRASQTHRIVFNADGVRTPLDQALAEQPVCETTRTHLKAQKNQKARMANVQVRYVRIEMPRPHATTPWVRQHGAKQISMSAVQVMEPHPPRGCEAVNWILLTSDRVAGRAGARQVIEDYEKRPVVEEFHKCVKTGCRVESRQYATARRLERVTAVQCVVAIRLLQLRSHARLTPDRPAPDAVPEDWVPAVCESRHRGRQVNAGRMTIRTSTAPRHARAASSAVSATANPAGSQSGVALKNFNRYSAESNSPGGDMGNTEAWLDCHNQRGLSDFTE